MQIVVQVFVLFFAVGGAVSTCFACSCSSVIVDDDLATYYEDADRVFVGRVTKITSNFTWKKRVLEKLDEWFGEPDYSTNKACSTYGNWVEFGVSESFKGVTSSTTVLTGHGRGDCGFPFEAGKTYFVMTLPSDDCQTGICTPTAPIEQAQDRIEFVRKLKK